MKKFASAATAILLVALMAMSCMVTVFAATAVDTSQNGSISLTKYDNVTGTPVADAVFSAYRILDFDGKTYTVNGSFTNQVEVSDIVNTDASQAGTLSYGSTTELEAQVSKLQNYIKTNSVDATSSATSGAEGTLTISDLPLGVYLVQETSVPKGYTVTTQAFLVAIPTWNQNGGTDGTGEWVYNVKATPKDELLKVDKQMKDEKQGTADGTKDDSYSIGDTIPYTVTAKIPNYGMSYDNPDITVTDNLLVQNLDNKGIENYNALNLTFTDTLTKGLTLDLNSLVVKVLGAAEDSSDVILTKGTTLAELESFTLSADNKTVASKAAKSGKGVGGYTAVSASEDDNTKMTVLVAWQSLDQYQGKTIQLTYNAQLNENAVVGGVNQNDVTYQFTNDPQQVMKDPKTTTSDTDKVYTYQMDLTKTFNGAAADGTTIDASDVEFELYVKKTDGGDVAKASQKMNFIKNSDGNYTVWTDETAPTDKTLVSALNPSSTGSLIVKGLEAGTYELKETKSLADYTILTEPVTILVEEVKEGDPAVVTQKVTAHTLAWNGTKAEKKDVLANADESGIFSLTVNNAKSQFNLPLTGGLGLWIFTIAGGAVMAGAIIFFTVLHKKRSKKS